MTRKARSWDGQPLEALQDRWDRPNIHLYSRVDSTNDRAKELANGDAPPGTLVIADEQTAGRGVSTRSWHSPRGAGLYLSIIFTPKQVPNPLLIPLLAGLSTARAVQRLLRGRRVGLKWPNDLIVHDRKAGGILSEVSWAGGEPKYVVLGVGVNVHQRRDDFPGELRDLAISLDMAAGREVSRLALADLVIREVEERCVSPPETLDRDFLKEFDEYDWLRDRRCVVQPADSDPVSGTAVGIAPDGALLFRPDAGALERVESGRVIAEELLLPNL
jgi:BirA family biotin operon repressor/biotin-[acetyl-CoA-carboxylase] ligase